MNRKAKINLSLIGAMLIVLVFVAGGDCRSDMNQPPGQSPPPWVAGAWTITFDPRPSFLGRGYYLWDAKNELTGECRCGRVRMEPGDTITMAAQFIQKELEP
jgi:hypothetical protein